MKYELGDSETQGVVTSELGAQQHAGRRPRRKGRLPDARRPVPGDSPGQRFQDYSQAVFQEHVPGKGPDHSEPPSRAASGTRSPGKFLSPDDDRSFGALVKHDFTMLGILFFQIVDPFTHVLDFRKTDGSYEGSATPIGCAKCFMQNEHGTFSTLLEGPSARNETYKLLPRDDYNLLDEPTAPQKVKIFNII